MGAFAATFLLALALAMDAFAASLARGAKSGLTPMTAVLIAATFGVLQALMPLIGLFAGWLLDSLIVAIDHWIAFILLGTIGIQMIREGLSASDDEDRGPITARAVLVLAIATSIDAAVAGVTLPFLGVSIPAALATIGVVTFALSLAGLAMGRTLGERFGSRAEILGGLILIGLGSKILIEHLSV